MTARLLTKNRRLPLLILAALVFFLLPTSAGFAADSYVSFTLGNNANDGDISRPFQTVYYAAQHLSTGDTLHIAPGTYTNAFVTNVDIAADYVTVIGDSDLPDGTKADSSSVILRKTNNGGGHIALRVNGESVTVREITVQDANIGLVSTGNYTRIDNVQALSNAADGISITSDSCTVVNSFFSSNNAAGLSLNNADNNLVFNNISRNNVEDGFIVELGGLYNRIESNTATGNAAVLGQGAVYLSNADSTLLINNRLTGNRRGVYIAAGSEYNIITRNIISGNTAEGVYIANAGCNYNRFVGNEISGNSSYGIRFGSNSTNYIQITQNDILGNGNDGIYITGLGSGVESIKYNNIFGNANEQIDNDASVLEAHFNFFNTTDSGVIATLFSGITPTNKWVPFRFAWNETSPTGDSVAPGTPQGFAISTLDDTSVRLNWVAPTIDEDGNPLTGLSGYRIYRAEDPALITTSTLHPRRGETVYTSFVDTGLTPGTVYYYYLTAFDNRVDTPNEGWYSNAVLGMTWTGPDWYVDTGAGFDTNPGSETLPFKTITRALGMLNAGETIHIGPGTYNEAVTLDQDSDYCAIIGDYNGADSSNVIIEVGDSTPGGFDERYGIFHNSADYVTVKDLTIQNANNGIVFYGWFTAVGFKIENVHIRLCQQGIDVDFLDLGTINQCLVETSQNTGIRISNSDSCTVSNSISSNNQVFGLRIGGKNCLIVNNIFSFNTNSGVSLSVCETSVFLNNTVSNNQRGFDLWNASSWNSIVGNLITNNTQQGIMFNNNCHHNKIIQNDFINNGTSGTFDGINIAAGSGANEITKNNFSENSGKAVNNSGYVGTCAYNFFTTTDSQTLADTLTGLNSDSWVPFRFDWVDTSAGGDSVAPQIVTNVDTAYGSIIVSWSTPTDNEDSSALSDLAGFRVYRFTNPNLIDTGSLQPPYYDLPNPAATSFTDDTIAAGQGYHYVVTAYDNASPFRNEGWYSEIVSAEGPFPDYSGPEWYVDTGSPHSGGNGSETYPFHTIALALGRLGAGETIHIAAGTYNETITITADSFNVAIIGDFDTRGVTADSSNVIIDVNNEALGSYGIYCSGVTGVTLQHLQILDAGNGIQMETSSYCRIMDITSSSHGFIGISARNSDSNIFSRIRMSQNGNSGFYLTGCNNNTIVQNRIEESISFTNIQLTLSNSNYLYQNIADSSAVWAGIQLYNDCDSNVLIENRIVGNDYCGIYLNSGGRWNLILNNTIASNREEGIYSYSCSENIIAGNSIFLNGRNGIRLTSNSDTNTLINNTITTNGRGGVSIEFGASRNLILQNEIFANGTTGNNYDGIFIDLTSSADTIHYNNIYNNSRNNLYSMSTFPASALYNYYGSTDSQTIADSITSGDTLTWVPFRLDWIDTRPGEDSIAPMPPTGVTVVNTSDSLKISWTAPAFNEDGSPLTDLDKYRIYRTTNPDQIDTGDIHFSVIETASAEAFDSGLTNGVTYYYHVTAVDNHAGFPNESWYSSPGFTTYSQTDWYVDTAAGNDAWPGTAMNPFKTIRRALQALGAGETIHIAPGVYNETITITADSGNVVIIGDYNGGDSSNVVIEAAANGDSSAGDNYNGVFVNGAVYVTIKDLRIQNAYTGVHLLNTNGCTIQNVHSALNGYSGFFLNNADTCLVYGNTADSSASFGIFLNQSDSCLVQANATRYSSLLGIQLNQSNHCGISGNLVLFSGLHGIYIAQTDSCLVQNNHVARSGQHGINPTFADYITIANNEVTENGRYGIYVQNTSQNTKIVQNDILGNGTSGSYDGIRVDAGCGAWLATYNNIIGNTDHPIDNAGHLGDARHNFYNTGDSSVIRTALNGLAGDSWVGFRFTWIDTAAGADSLAPAPPDTVAIVPLTTTSVYVSWAVPTVDEDSSPLSGPISGYRVYRTRNPLQVETGSLQPPYLETANTSFVDSGLAEDDTYYYYVTAFDAHAPYANESWYSVGAAGIGAATYHGPHWYVDTAVGFDTNPGMDTAPFKTLTRALQALGAGETIHIAPGTYNETVALFADSDYVTLIGDYNGGDSANVIINAGDSNQFNQHGILCTGVVGVALRSLRIENGVNGVYILNSDSCRIEDVLIRLCNNGVWADRSRRTLIASNTIESLSGDWYGVYLAFFSETNIIQNNLIKDIEGWGYFTALSNNNLFDGNRVENTTQAGAYVQGDSNIVSNNRFFNTCLGNGEAAVEIHGGDYCLIKENTILFNNRDGILFSSSDRNSVYSNLISSNKGRAVSSLNTSSLNRITQNDFQNNGTLGDSDVIFVGTGTNLTDLSYNNFFGNSRYSINCVGLVNSAQYNYYGTADSRTIADSMNGMVSDSWVGFRFARVDTRPGADSLAPSSPPNILLTPTGENGVHVTWDAPTVDEDSSPLTGLNRYRVYRTQNHSQFDTGSLQPAYAEVPAGVNEFIDSGLSAGGHYSYWVTSVQDTSASNLYENESWYGGGQIFTNNYSLVLKDVNRTTTDSTPIVQWTATFSGGETQSFYRIDWRRFDTPAFIHSSGTVYTKNTIHAIAALEDGPGTYHVRLYVQGTLGTGMLSNGDDTLFLVDELDIDSPTIVNPGFSPSAIAMTDTRVNMWAVFDDSQSIFFKRFIIESESWTVTHTIATTETGFANYLFSDLTFTAGETITFTWFVQDGGKNYAIETATVVVDTTTTDVDPPYQVWIVNEASLTAQVHGTPVEVEIRALDARDPDPLVFRGLDGINFVQSDTILLSSDSIYTIFYYAQDHAGNATTIRRSNGTIKVDLTPPDTRIVYYQPSSGDSRTTYGWGIDPNDIAGDSDYHLIVYDSPSANFTGSTSVFLDTWLASTFALVSGIQDDSSYYAALIVRDKLGRLSDTSLSGITVVDYTLAGLPKPDTPHIDYPADGSNTTAAYMTISGRVPYFTNALDSGWISVNFIRTTVDSNPADSYATWSVQIPLVAGQNVVTAVAFNRGGFASDPDTIIITRFGEALLNITTSDSFGRIGLNLERMSITGIYADTVGDVPFLYFESNLPLDPNSLDFHLYEDGETVSTTLSLQMGDTIVEMQFSDTPLQPGHQYTVVIGPATRDALGEQFGFRREYPFRALVEADSGAVVRRGGVVLEIPANLLRFDAYPYIAHLSQNDPRLLNANAKVYTTELLSLLPFNLDRTFQIRWGDSTGTITAAFDSTTANYGLSYFVSPADYGEATLNAYILNTSRDGWDRVVTDLDPLTTHVYFRTNNSNAIFTILNEGVGGGDKALTYPNPYTFRTDLTIAFRLASNGETRMRIFTLMGLLVYDRTFASGQVGGLAGLNQVRLTPGECAQFLASGGYILFLEGPGLSERVKMAVAR